jgi:hypothetical protein
MFMPYPDVFLSSAIELRLVLIKPPEAAGKKLIECADATS